MLRCCLNPKILIGVALAAVSVLAFDPHLFTRVLPLLIAAVCPLSMILMMGGAFRKKPSGAGATGSSETADSASSIRKMPEVDAAGNELPALDTELIRLRAELQELRAAHEPRSVPDAGTPLRRRAPAVPPRPTA